jgi:hypothetical protein
MESSRGKTMATCYNMTGENEAWYRIEENGEAAVSVRSKTPLKPRAIYVGEASLQFYWVHSGKSSHWQFMPTLLNPAQAKYSEVIDGQDQTINIEFGKGMFPASGLINSNVCGEIRAPAVHFDLPYAYDLWVFILRSPWAPLKVEAEKSSLSITHALAQAVAQLEYGDATFGDEGKLRTYVNIHGEGFTKVEVNVKRHTSHSAVEETLGDLSDGGASFSWKPQVRNFDVVLTTSSSMAERSFLDFLKYLGAQVQTGFFANVAGDFLLCDGPAREYTLTLKGEKKYIGKEEDKTGIKLSF